MISKKTTIIVTIIILILFFVAYTFFQKEFQLNKKTSDLYLSGHSINFHSKYKLTSNINFNSYDDNTNFMTEFPSSTNLNEIKKTGLSYLPFLENKNYYHPFPANKNLHHSIHFQISNAFHTNDYRDITKSCSNNHNYFSQSVSFNEYPLELFKLKSKRVKNDNSTNSQENTSQQHNGFYSYYSESLFARNNPFENNYNSQDIIIDPGDPPEGNPIPVQDGTYILFFLVGIYGIWKIKLYLKNN